MAGVRQLRVFLLTGLVLVLVFVLHRVGQNAASLVHSQASDQIGNKIHANKQPIDANQVGVPTNKKNPIVVSNNLVNSNNDEKTDNAINKEISKGKSEEGIKEISKDQSNSDTGGSSSNGIGNGIGSGIGSGSSNKQETVNDNGEYDPQADLMTVRALSPMTIFSKSQCPYSKRLKKLLEKYEILPEPKIVELDIHDHGKELQNYLLEKTGRGTVPNVLVGSSLESRGGSDDFQEYHNKNQLAKLLTSWGQGQLQVAKIDTPSNA